MSKNREMTIPSSLKSLQPVGQRHGKDVFQDNPFIENFCVEVRKKSVTIAAGLSIADKENNEVKAGAVATFQEVDTEQFLKIYTQNVKSLFDLSGTAQRLLMPLMLEVQKSAKNVAHLYFCLSDAQNNCIELGLPPISKASYSRGIKELIEREFIAINSRGQNWYWINPNILFNGDRIRYIQEYKIKRKNDELTTPEQLSLL